MRIWALVTEDYRIYVYKEGYLRTSSSEYDTNNRSN
jgi:Tubulin-tyrosine ligase family